MPDGAAATTFDVLAAIDVRRGRVVRLQQGDFARETAYATDPPAVAARFVRDGVAWLHVVDLDAARGGEGTQAETMARMLAATAGRARVEVAGGLRTVDAVGRALDAGAARAVLGTAALSDPDMIGRLVREFGPERIAVAIDVREGHAVGEGWRPGARRVPAELAIDRLVDEGAETFEVTAIDRDGLLGGPDVPLLERLVTRGRGRIVASGGIRSVDDLLAVRRLGCTGAIVGRALYDGTLSLEAALAGVASAPG
jgi:phosphoribosylformimino-5-aminoimidazole carboxamide ribotide isomerase